MKNTSNHGELFSSFFFLVRYPQYTDASVFGLTPSLVASLATPLPRKPVRSVPSRVTSLAPPLPQWAVCWLFLFAAKTRSLSLRRKTSVMVGRAEEVHENCR